MSGSKRTSTQPKEWAKHLRPFGKKEFWSSVRNIFRSEEKKDLLANENIDWPKIDPEELKRNKEEYNRELANCLSGEPDTRTPYIVAKRIDDGINEQSVIPEGLMSEKLIEALGGVRMSPERMEENLRNMNNLCENGVQPLTNFKPVFPTPFQPSVDFNGDPGYEFPKEPEIFLMGQDDKELHDYVDKKVASANKILDKMEEENGISVGDGFGNILFHTTMTMPCPEPNQINPISPEKANEIFKDIRGRMGEPGPQSIDDLLPEVTNIPPSTNQQWELSVAIFWTPQTGFEAKVVTDHDLLNQRGYMDFVGSGKIVVSIPAPKFSHECPCCD